MKKPKSDIWMPLYIGDYLRSTMGLSRADHGSYLLLIMAYWENDGPLPDDAEHLAGIAKVQQCEWQCVSNRLAKFFQVRDGVWRHDRIDRELEEAKARHLRRSKAGKLGAEAKRKQCSSNAEAGLVALDKQSQSQSHIAERERADRPSLEEVKIQADRIGLAAWKAEDWFNEMEGGGWLDHQHRPVSNWRAILSRVRTKWEADGRPKSPPSNATNQRTNRQGADRNAGTANNPNDYANVQSPKILR